MSSKTDSDSRFDGRISKFPFVDMIVIHTLFECVTLLLNQNVKAKHHMNISVNAEDYYRIKDSEKER